MTFEDSINFENTTNIIPGKLRKCYRNWRYLIETSFQPTCAVCVLYILIIYKMYSPRVYTI